MPTSQRPTPVAGRLVEPTTALCERQDAADRDDSRVIHPADLAAGVSRDG